MGKREVVVYVCDWCEQEGRPDVVEHPAGRDTFGSPLGWAYCDRELFCDGCLKARRDALDDARKRCRNRVASEVSG